MAITQSQLADIVTGYLYDDTIDKATNIDPSLLTGYPAMRRLLRKKQIKEQPSKGIRWTYTSTSTNNTAGFGYYQEVTYDNVDTLVQGNALMRMWHNNYSFDVQEEEFAHSKNRIVDHIKAREQTCMIDMTTFGEASFWTNPASTDALRPHGLLYHFPYCASAGFVGTYPSGYTDYQGLDPATYTGLKSYGDVYVDVTQDDLILKMRTAAVLTEFEAPLDSMLVADMKMGSSDIAYYMNYVTLQKFENQLRVQNDNLGPDVAWADGKAMFKGSPLTRVPYLTSNSRNPVFGVNWAHMKHYVQDGWWMKRIPGKAPAQPLVMTVDMFCSDEFVCTDRRQGGFNIATA